MPSNIANFERLYYGSLIVELIQIVLSYDQQVAEAAKLGYGPGLLAVMHIVSFVLYIALIWFAARQRKNWARWTLLVFFLASLAAVLSRASDIIQTEAVQGGLVAVYLLMQAGGLFLAFSGNSRIWFSPGPSLTI